MSFIDYIDESLLLPEDIDVRYLNSPFRYIKYMSPRKKGKRFEQMVESIYKKLGYVVENSTSTDYDRIINGKRCEIKGSTLIKNKNIFSFLQIRPDQEYDCLVFAMFYPDNIVIMEMKKENIKNLIDAGMFKKQHGGNKAESGTYCFYGNEKTLSNHGANFIT